MCYVSEGTPNAKAKKHNGLVRRVYGDSPNGRLAKQTKEMEMID